MKQRIIKVVVFITILILVWRWYVGRPDTYEPQRDFQNIEKQLLTEFILAEDSSVISLPKGHFIFSRSLTLSGLHNVRIIGKGIDKTVLSFKGQKEGAEGLRIDNCTNILLEDFTVEDASGDNIKVQDTDGITFRRIKAAWTGPIGEDNGAYGLYPVICKNVLIEQCEVLGSSDAGIYVGQSNEVIIRENIVYKNVAGIESENSTNVEIFKNIAHDNTGGILVFDLPGLTTYGRNINVYENQVYNNNRRNFGTKGAIVSNIPAGTGMLILATEQVSLYNNSIADHRTLGIGIISYDLVYGMEEEIKDSELVNAYGEVRSVIDYKEDKDYDSYPSDINIYDNNFSNKHWMPNISTDFGKLFLFKLGFKIPDIVYDGIYPKERGSPNICINDTVLFVNMDAGGNFNEISHELDNRLCAE